MLKLNQEQLQAINTTEGNLLIIASAGTGKTTTIVERYLNMVQDHDYKIDQVLMTTFTNKAAKDMIKKISKRTTQIPQYVGTMHSLFLKILRKHYLQPTTTIIDEADKKKLLKKILLERNINTKSDHFQYFLKQITKFKNHGIPPENLDQNPQIINPTKQEIIFDDEILNISPELQPLVPQIYQQYQNILKKNNFIDLDDILLLTLQLFENNKNIKKQYQQQFKSIMVDEAQDLNIVQIKILDLIKNNNLCLIGDDCQNIYEWRGSSNELVFKFNQHYPTITLTDNYRSTKSIIKAVNNSIDYMNFKIDKQLTPTREKGTNIIVEPFFSSDEEIEFLLKEVNSLIKNNTPLNEIALLCRTNNLGKQLEREFRKNKIPCQLSKSKNFFEREEIKDLLSFLKFKINPYSEIDFARTLSLVGGFGKVKIDLLIRLSQAKKCSLFEILQNFSQSLIENNLKQKLAQLLTTLKNQNQDPVSAFFNFFQYENHISKKYKDDSNKIEEKLANLKVLQEIFKQYPSAQQGLQTFLDELIDIEKQEKDHNKVTISTIHSSKGLEWQHVFLPFCNDTILPFYRYQINRTKWDSELRLFYVAISRAKDTLTLTLSENQQWRKMTPSPFLEIIHSF